MFALRKIYTYKHENFISFLPLVVFSLLEELFALEKEKMRTVLTVAVVVVVVIVDIRHGWIVVCNTLGYFQVLSFQVMWYFKE